MDFKILQATCGYGLALARQKGKVGGRYGFTLRSKTSYDGAGHQISSTCYGIDVWQKGGKKHGHLDTQSSY
jgi:hypothetical protein